MNTQTSNQQPSAQQSSSRISSTALIGRVARRGLVVLLLVCGFAPAAQAQAQAPTEPLHAYARPQAKASDEEPADAYRIPLKVSSTTWRDNIGEQSARSLRSRNEAMRAQALQNVIFFATHNGDVLDFSKAVPALLDIYRGDRNEAHRIMALAALHAIGNRYSMGYLAERMVSKRFKYVRPRERYLRRLTWAVLADYAGKQRAQ